MLQCESLKPACFYSHLWVNPVGLVSNLLSTTTFTFVTFVFVVVLFSFLLLSCSLQSHFSSSVVLLL